MNNNNGENTPLEDNLETALNEPFHAVDIAGIAIESANLGIWIADPISSNFFPSNRTKELFGFLPDEEMSFEAAMLRVVEKHRKRVTETIESAYKKRTRLCTEYPIIIPHLNTKRWLSVIGGFSSPSESNSYFSGIVMDITEQKQHDLRRSKFIGMVSHELKTPLTALKAYVQLLNNWARKQKDHFTVGTLSKVDKQVRKMLNMINSLLNLSGAEAWKIHLNKLEFQLEVLISEVVEETMFITATHQIMITPAEPVTINADRDKIEQVLVNLLSNAAKYSDKNGLIEIGYQRTGHNVEVSVKDQGFGISSEDTEAFSPTLSRRK